jgi:hypothetical protein
MELYSAPYSGRGKYPIPLATRFWSKVLKGDNCWEWQSLKNELGYGEIRQGSSKEPKVKAHRVSWEIHFGPIPERMIICHKCDNPSCVNPEHLFLGSFSDNMRDMDSKGRRRKNPVIGERHHRAKLSDKKVTEIRDKFLPFVVTKRQLALEYGVSEITIKNVLSRRTWRHLP